MTGGESRYFRCLSHHGTIRVFCVYSRFICVKYLLLLPHHRGRPIQIENSERPDAQGLLSDK
jgi:hypothetical protein